MYAATSRGLTSNMSDYFYNPADSVSGLVNSPYMYAGAQKANPAVQKSLKGKPLNYIADLLEAKYPESSTKKKTNLKIAYWLNDLSGEPADGGLKTPPKIGAWTGGSTITTLSNTYVRSFDKGKYSMSYSLKTTPEYAVGIKRTLGIKSYISTWVQQYWVEDQGFYTALANETTTMVIKQAMQI